MSTARGTLRLRESMHSNTFLLGGSNTPISRVYEAVPVSYQYVYSRLPASLLCAPVFHDLTALVTRPEALEIVSAYHLLHRDTSAGNGVCAASIAPDDILKVLCYMQALEDPADFSLYDCSVRQWALRNFKGTGTEIGLFLLLKHADAKRPDEFLKEWRSKDLCEPDVRDLLAHVDQSPIAQKQGLLPFLNKLL